MKMISTFAGLLLCSMALSPSALAKGKADKVAPKRTEKFVAGDHKPPCEKPLTAKRAALLNSKGAEALFDAGVKKPGHCEPFFLTRLFVEKALGPGANDKVGIHRPKAFRGDCVSIKEGVRLLNVVFTQSQFPPTTWIDIDPKELDEKPAAPAPVAKKEPPARPARSKSPGHVAGERKPPCKKPLTAKKAALLNFGIAEVLFDEAVKKAEQCEPFFITRLFIEKVFGPGSSEKVGVNKPKEFNGDYISKKEGTRYLNLTFTQGVFPPKTHIDIDLKELEK